MADRIFVWKRLSRERITDDGDGRSPIDIRIGKVATSDEPDAHRCEVSRAAQSKTGLRQETEVACRPVLSFDGIRAAGIVLTRGQAHDSTGCRNVGNMPEAFDNVVDCLSRAKIILKTGLVENRTSRRSVRIGDEQMIFPKTERNIR